MGGPAWTSPALLHGAQNSHTIVRTKKTRPVFGNLKLDDFGSPTGEMLVRNISFLPEKASRGGMWQGANFKGFHGHQAPWGVQSLRKMAVSSGEIL